MDDARFDALSRALDEARSRRGALAVTFGGFGFLLSLAGVEAGKKRGKKKGKRSCPECICPAPDTCPARTCCFCESSPGTYVCRYAAHATNEADYIANCQAACSDIGPATAAHPSSPGQSIACSTTGDSCVRVGCPA